jgi:hypothetical protein
MRRKTKATKTKTRKASSPMRKRVRAKASTSSTGAPRASMRKRVASPMTTPLGSAPTQRQIAERPAARFATYGDSGLKRYSGYIVEEWQAELRGQNGAKTYREMIDNEPVLGVSVRAQELLVASAPVQVKAAESDDPRAEDARRFVAECIEDLENGWSGFVSEALSCITYGWAYLEKMFKIRGGGLPGALDASKYSDGRIGWRSFELRGQQSLDKWELTEHGRTLGMWQQPENGISARRYIPREKALHVRVRPHLNNPEGYSSLRIAYTSYYHAKNIRFSEAVGIEKNLIGMPVMQVPARCFSANASQSDQDIVDGYEKMTQRLRIDEQYGAVIHAERENGEETGFKFELKSGGGTQPIQTDPVIRRYEQRMAQSQLAEFILLGTEATGSYALSSDKTSFFARVCGAMLDVVLEPLNREAVPELIELNGWPRELAPTIVRGDLESQALDAIAQYLSSLVSVGVITPDADLEAWAREQVTAPAAMAPSVSAPAPDARPETDAADIMAGGADAAAADEKLADTALNGAQVTSLLEVIERTSLGKLPRDTAVAIITAAFNMEPSRADAILGSVGRGFVPAADASAPVMSGAANVPA